MSIHEKTVLKVARFLLAIAFPPIAVSLISRSRIRLTISIIATLILPLIYVIYIWIKHGSAISSTIVTTTTFPYYIFLFALPGSMYACWMTINYYLNDSCSEMDLSPSDLPTNDIIQPTPQRLASAYQHGYMVSMSPNPIGITSMNDDMGNNSKKKDYSPVTISPYSSMGSDQA